MVTAALWLVAALAVGGVSFAAAQAVYVWRDERGVLNFSDQPPPTDIPGVEERLLGVSPAPVGAATPAPSGGVGFGEEGRTETGGSPAGRNRQREEGPARVVIARQEVEPVSQDVRELRGRVLNMGGTTARRVAVAYRITDPGQGTPCITGEIPVEPGDLEPRATGQFEALLETPCFRGNAGIELSPAWD